MIELILPPTRSLGTGVASLFAGGLVVLVSVALIADPVLTDIQRLAVSLLGALFALTLAAVGITLLRGHGALLLDREGGFLGLGVTRQTDTWWLPLADVEGLQVVPLPHPGKDVIDRWMLLLGLRDRPDVVIAESDDRGAIVGIRERLAARLSIPELGDDRASPLPSSLVSREVRFAVSRGAALQGLLTVFGASLIAVGIISFSEMQREPVVGFIFAPILVVMGVVLGLVPLVKRLASETLSFDGTRWTHAFTFSRWRWSVRSVRGARPRFRLRLLGMRGGLLELVGDDGILILAAGATAHSRLGLEAVSRIPSRFAGS